MRKRPTTPKINDGRLNAKKKSRFPGLFEFNKMAVSKPSRLEKRRYAGAMSLYIET